MAFTIDTVAVPLYNGLSSVLLGPLLALILSVLSFPVLLIVFTILPLILYYVRSRDPATPMNWREETIVITGGL
jgi:hypothetical protein